MLRKIAVWVSVVLLLLSFPVPVPAHNTAPVSVISAYYLNGVVYMAACPDEGVSLEELQVRLRLYNGIYYDMSGQAGPADLTEYVLLVDLSTSMPYYRNFIFSLADALLPEETEGIRVTVAGFGERFEILAEDITGKEKLRSELSAIRYSHQATDISGGMTEALNYFSGGEHRDAREMVHLILLTDGIPYLTGDPENEKAAIKAAAETAAEAVSVTSEVIVHTVYFRADGEETTYSAVSAGKGLNLIAENAGAASEAGSAIRQFTGSLYKMVFSPVDWEFGKERTDIQMVISDPGAGSLAFVPVENLRDISTPLAVEVNRPVIIKPETEDTEPEPPDTPSDGTGTEGQPEEENPSGEESDPGEENGSGGNQKVVLDPDQIKNLPFPVSAVPGSGFPVRIMALAAGAGMLFTALVAALIYLLVRNRGRNRGRRKPEPGAIGMKLEVVSGSCKEDGRRFSLKDQLFIGSERSCDIVFSDPSVPGRSTRVFLQEQTVYIEDLNERTGTSLGGMKIYAPNRLRSGDEIQIGNVCFRFLF